MNSIDDVINYSCDFSLQAAFLDGQALKQCAFEQAKVIYLLYDHSAVAFKSQCSYYEDIIKCFYQAGDIILLEEDASLKADQLARNFIPGLKPAVYRAKGWDSPICCQQTKELVDLAYHLNKAIEAIWSHTATAYQWQSLLQFAKQYQCSALTAGEVDSYLNGTLSKIQHIKVASQIQVLCMKCQLELEKLKIAHIYSTFQMRQDALAKSIQKKAAKYKRIFVVAGRNHGYTTDEKIKPILMRHFQQLQLSFVIIRGPQHLVKML